MTHPLAGKPAPRELLVDLELLRRRYFDKPDPADPQQRVSFGTSGHRGSSLRGSFNEAHILAVTQAVCEYRKAQGTTGPLFLGADTHALSEPAQHTALQVLAANEVEVLHAPEGEWTPTPVISHAILVHNRGRTAGLADGIVITPSHNPPEDGGIKYNPPSGGPADTSATGWIERRDPTFSFMPLDHDGKIRMDCSSPYAMANLVALKDRYDLAFGNDTDSDRHGIVTPGQGLLNPNHYLAASIGYLFRNRPGWSARAAVGKTLVSSSLIDRVAHELGRELREVPVGFKWFVDGLLDGSLGFGGEESAGASFLRRDGSVWTTDKDGIVPALLSAEITARMGRDPGEIYRTLTREFGEPAYDRVEAPATPEQKELLSRLSPAQVRHTDLAGERIQSTLSRAPGNGAPIGGVKVITESGWFAARPSGTEDIYKIYAESFRGVEHLHRIQAE